MDLFGVDQQKLNNLILILQGKGILNDNEVDWINFGKMQFYHKELYQLMSAKEYAMIFDKHSEHECDKKRFSFHPPSTTCDCGFQLDEKSFLKEVNEILEARAEEKITGQVFSTAIPNADRKAP